MELLISTSEIVDRELSARRGFPHSGSAFQNNGKSDVWLVLAAVDPQQVLLLRSLVVLCLFVAKLTCKDMRLGAKVREVYFITNAEYWNKSLWDCGRSTTLQNIVAA